MHDSIHTRVFRTMALTTAFTVAVAAFVAPWRVTMGLLVGGLLALFSHNWLKNSAAAAIHLSAVGGQPQLRLAQFVLRYAVIGAVIFSAYTLESHFAARRFRRFVEFCCGNVCRSFKRVLLRNYRARGN